MPRANSFTQCAFCLENHFSSECRAYRSVTQRMRKAVERKLCVRCLSSNHATNKCQSMKMCYFCKRNDHHLSLCVENSGRCVWCLDDHPTTRCSVYRTTAERAKVAHQRNLCIRCLQHTNVTRCESDNSCHFCRKDHHYLLCNKGGSSLAPSRSRRTVSPEYRHTRRRMHTESPSGRDYKTSRRSPSSRASKRSRSRERSLARSSKHRDVTRHRSRRSISPPNKVHRLVSPRKSSRQDGSLNDLPYRRSQERIQQLEREVATPFVGATRFKRYVPPELQQPTIGQAAPARENVVASSTCAVEQNILQATASASSHSQCTVEEQKASYADLLKANEELKKNNDDLGRQLDAEKERHVTAERDRDQVLQWFNADKKQVHEMEEAHARQALELNAYRQALRLTFQFSAWLIKRKITGIKEAQSSKELGPNPDMPKAARVETMQRMTTTADASEGTSGTAREAQPPPTDALKEAIEKALRDMPEPTRRKYAIFVADNLRSDVSLDDAAEFLMEKDPANAALISAIKEVRHYV